MASVCLMVLLHSLGPFFNGLKLCLMDFPLINLPSLLKLDVYLAFASSGKEFLSWTMLWENKYSLVFVFEPGAFFDLTCLYSEALPKQDLFIITPLLMSLTILVPSVMLRGASVTAFPDQRSRSMITVSYMVPIPYLWSSLPIFSVPIVFLLFLRWGISISHVFQNAGVTVLYSGIVMLLYWSVFLNIAGNAVSLSGYYWTFFQNLCETLRTYSSAVMVRLESVICMWTGIASCLYTQGFTIRLIDQDSAALWA